jgi:Lon protease (S16) C-terminal proteolytic domain
MVSSPSLACPGPFTRLKPAPPVTIPKGASFKDMVALKGDPDIGNKINTQVIQPLIDANTRLARSDFPDFNDPNKLGEGAAKVERLSNLVAIFQKPELFKESFRCAEQNLYVRPQELIGDRDPRQHEYSVQLRAFDSAKSGSGIGVGVLLALCSSLLQKSIKGGLAITGGLNLGGSIETIFNPVAVVELAIEKGATSILMPINSRRQLNDLPDDLAAKIIIHYYLDARDALLKALTV